MLKLTRYVNQVLVVGDARITILRTQGGQVWLGIEAPKRIPVYREELGGEHFTEKSQQATPPQESEST